MYGDCLLHMFCKYEKHPPPMIMSLLRELRNRMQGMLLAKGAFTNTVHNTMMCIYGFLIFLILYQDQPLTPFSILWWMVLTIYLYTLCSLMCYIECWFFRTDGPFCSLSPHSGEEKTFNKMKYFRNVMGRRTSKRQRRLYRKHTKRLYGHFRMSPQFGMVAPSERVVAQITDLISFLVMVADAKTYKGILAASYMYSKTFSSRDVWSVMKQAIDTVLMQPQGSNIDMAEIIETLRLVRENWQLAIKSPGILKVRRLLSILLAAGLCDKSALDYQIGGVTLFSIEACREPVDALTLADAVFDMTVFFVEGGYRCFLSKSLSPLLISDSRADEFLASYSDIMNYANLVRAGNLELIAGITPNDYEHRLSKIIEECELLVKTTTNRMDKALFTRRLLELKSVDQILKESRLTGGLREAPYAVGIWGESGAGKSSVAQVLMHTILEYNGYDSDPEKLITLNEQDAFMSNYRSYINGIYIDDQGNAKPAFCKKSPAQTMIELVNNVRMYATMAELELKGRVSVEPKVVVVTKNPKTGGAQHYSVEPVSVMRREKLLIHVEPKPQFKVNGMLDSTTVARFFEDRGIPIPDIPDYWQYVVERAYPIPTEGNGPADTGWEKILVTDSLEELLDLLYNSSSKHFENQKRLVENNNKMCQTIRKKMCEHCRKLFCTGQCIAVELSDISDSDSESETGSSKSISVMTVGSRSKDSSVDTETTGYTKRFEGPFTVTSTDTVIFGQEPDRRKKYFNRDPYGDNSDNVTLKTVGKEGDPNLPMDSVIEPDIMYYERMTNEAVHRLRTKELYLQPEMGAIATMGIAYVRSVIVSTLWNHFSGYWDSAWETFAAIYSREKSQQLFEEAAHDIAAWAMESYGSAPLSLIPDFILKSDFFRRSFLHITHPYYVYQTKNIVRLLYCISIASYISLGGIIMKLWMVNNPFRIWWALIFFTIGFYTMLDAAVHCSRVQIAAYEMIIHRRDLMPERLRAMREDAKKYLLISCGAIGALMGAWYLFKQIRPLCTEGNLHPTSAEDLDARDAEVNVWATKPTAEPMEVDTKLSTMTLDQLKNVTQKNLVYMKGPLFTRDGNVKTTFCNGFFLMSNVLLIPNHMIENAEEWKVTVYKGSPDQVGSRFATVIYPEHCVRIPHTDLCVVWMPKGGDHRNVMHLFPNGSLRNTVSNMLYRQEDGSVTDTQHKLRSGIVRMADVSSVGLDYKGAYYDHEDGTFAGLCMGVHLAKEKTPFIAGFHLAGNGQVGAIGTVCRSELDAAISQLDAIPGVLRSTSTSSIPKSQLGVSYYKDNEVHPKSAVNFLPEGSYMKYYGQLFERARPVSAVVTTIMSEHVSQIMGVPNKWGKPKLKNNAESGHYPYQKSLAYSVVPSSGVPGRLLTYAVEDYKNEILQLLENYTFLLPDIRPLNKSEVVNGIAGKRFIDRMKASTSPGFPLSGRKDKWFNFSEDDPTFVESIDPMFWDQVETMKESIRRGERCNAIFKACLKDEATKLDSDKVRVFQSAPMALQLLIRAYFLPLARVLSMYPLISECAVGINAVGPEWQQMSDHICKYGSERILAGDYSKYDLRMSPQLVLAAFRILIDIAKFSSNYTDDDLLIMQGIATEVAYPLVAYNGDLIGLYGGNPSGHNMTVYINSIVNSLLFRSGFAAIYGTSYRFSDCVALMTYGDDAKSSVKEGFEEFNHISYAEFLAEHDMVFTMPDKTSVPVPFMNDNDADFLKRKNVLHEDLQCRVGVLDEESIFKMLHTCVKSKQITPEEQAGNIIDSAMHELFFHGREKYTLRQSQLKQIANDLGLTEFTNLLLIDYDDRVSDWFERYGGK